MSTMKKKALVMFASLTLVLATLLCGCSGKDYDFAGSDLSAYITLPSDFATRDYTAGLDLKAEPTEKDVEDEIKSVLEDNFTEPVDLDDDAKVEDGDEVVMDYVGTFPGETEPFEGGSASDQKHKIDLDNLKFIEGFEAGIIGMKKGETKDLNLKFPNPYTNNPDYAGKDVVFKVTIDSISRTTVSELTDELVANNPDVFGADVTTAQGYRDHVKKDLEDEWKNGNKSKIINAAWKYVLENSTYAGYPDGLLDKYTKTYVDYYEHTVAAADGKHLKDYVVSQGYSSIESFKENVIVPKAEEAIKQKLALYACAKAMEVTVTDAQAKDAAKAQYEQNIVPSLQFYSAYLGITDFNSYLDYLGGLDSHKESMLFDRTFEKVTGTADAE